MLFLFKPGADCLVVQTFHRFAEDFRIERRIIYRRNWKTRMVNRNIVGRKSEVETFKNVLCVVRITNHHTKLVNVTSWKFVPFYRKLLRDFRRVHRRHTRKHQHTPGQSDQERKAWFSVCMFSAQHNNQLKLQSNFHSATCNLPLLREMVNRVGELAEKMLYTDKLIFIQNVVERELSLIIALPVCLAKAVVVVLVTATFMSR